MLRRRRRALTLTSVGAVVLAIGGGVLSLALFGDQKPVVQPFSVGTISLGVSPASTLVTFSAMVPGNEIDGALTVQNVGTGDLRYAMTSVSTDADGKHLRDVLHLDVERRTGCGGTVLETVYGGAMGGASFGNPQAGPDTGDRQLAAGASEVLCFRASLPLGTDIRYAGAATTVTLTFLAEQVAANP